MESGLGAPGYQPGRRKAGSLVITEAATGGHAPNLQYKDGGAWKLQAISRL